MHYHVYVIIQPPHEATWPWGVTTTWPDVRLPLSGAPRHVFRLVHSSTWSRLHMTWGVTTDQIIYVVWLPHDPRCDYHMTWSVNTTWPEVWIPHDLKCEYHMTWGVNTTWPEMWLSDHMAWSREGSNHIFFSWAWFFLNKNTKIGRTLLSST